MTKRECAIAMAYTGVSMLQGDDLKIFYDYVSEILGGEPSNYCPRCGHKFIKTYYKGIKEEMRSEDSFKHMSECCCEKKEIDDTIDLDAPNYDPTWDRLKND